LEVTVAKTKDLLGKTVVDARLVEDNGLVDGKLILRFFDLTELTIKPGTSGLNITLKDVK
jgi:hypothetical protein